MGKMRIEPAVEDRFDDAQQVFAAGGDGPSCQCQWWLQTNAEWRTSSKTEREADFRAETASSIPPGLIAYLDDEPIGWVRVSPRITQHRLPRTRVVTGGSTEPMDAEDVWAITCFSISSSARGQGLMRTLIDAAVAFAQKHGARVVEAYPSDPTAKRIPTNDLYVGVESTFREAGFEVVSRPNAHRAVMTRHLS